MAGDKRDAAVEKARQARDIVVRLIDTSRPGDLPDEHVDAAMEYLDQSEAVLVRTWESMERAERAVLRMLGR